MVSDLVIVALLHCPVVCGVLVWFGVFFGFFVVGFFFFSCLFWNRRDLDEKELIHKLWKFDRTGFHLKGVRKLERIQDYALSWICYCFFTTVAFFQECHTFNFDILYLTVAMDKGALYYKHCQSFSVGFLEFFLVILFRELGRYCIERQLDYISIIKIAISTIKKIIHKCFWLCTPWKFSLLCCFAHHVSFFFKNKPICPKWWMLVTETFTLNVSALVLQASLREEKKLRVENAKLKKEIEGLKQELIQAEIRNGGRQKSAILIQHRCN